eukprot:364687-Chlamydomonas_euryale.AAC.4
MSLSCVPCRGPLFQHMWPRLHTAGHFLHHLHYLPAPTTAAAAPRSPLKSCCVVTSSRLSAHPSQQPSAASTSSRRRVDGAVCGRGCRCASPATSAPACVGEGAGTGWGRGAQGGHAEASGGAAVPHVGNCSALRMAVSGRW